MASDSRRPWVELIGAVGVIAPAAPASAAAAAVLTADAAPTLPRVTVLPAHPELVFELQSGPEGGVRVVTPAHVPTTIVPLGREQAQPVTIARPHVEITAPDGHDGRATPQPADADRAIGVAPPGALPTPDADRPQGMDCAHDAASVAGPSTSREATKSPLVDPDADTDTELDGPFGPQLPLTAVDRALKSRSKKTRRLEYNVSLSPQDARSFRLEVMWQDTEPQVNELVVNYRYPESVHTSGVIAMSRRYILLKPRPVSLLLHRLHGLNTVVRDEALNCLIARILAEKGAPYQPEYLSVDSLQIWQQFQSVRGRNMTWYEAKNSPRLVDLEASGMSTTLYVDTTVRGDKARRPPAGKGQDTISAKVLAAFIDFMSRDPGRDGGPPTGVFAYDSRPAARQCLLRGD